MMKAKAKSLTQSRQVAKWLAGRMQRIALRLRAVEVADDRLEAAALRLGVKLCVLCVSVLILSGCASTDGMFHTPLTGISTEKAYRLAGEAGYLRQQTEAGGRWMNVVQLEALGLGPKALMALDGAALLEGQLKQMTVFKSLGRTDAQMVSAYNPSGVTLAKIGDGVLATALAAGITAGAAALADDGDDGGGSKTSEKTYPTQTATADQAVQISGSGNTIAIEVAP